MRPPHEAARWGGTFTLELLRAEDTLTQFPQLRTVISSAFDVHVTTEVILPTLHVHLDESGDLNFSPTGSPYFVFAAAWTYEPAPLANELTALRFSLVKQGHGERLSGFHAREDAEPKRDKVFEVLEKHKNWTFAALVVTKSR